MKTTFQTNLKCQSCVQRITPVLDADSTIQSWSADVSGSQKLLTVETNGQSDAPHVIDLLKQAGFDAAPIADDQINTGQTTSATHPGSLGWLATYKPLLLVLAYVLGLTAFTQWIGGAWDAQLAMSQFMGFFFLGFAFFKLLNVTGFADAFSTYDVIAKRSHAYALAYPFIELALGLAFLSNRLPVASAIVTIVIMAIGLIGVIAAVRKQQSIQCACLGTVFNLPMSVVTIVENTAMILMAVAMLMMRAL